MLIIGIAGGTGSGKTTVVHQIMNELPEAEVGVISQDSYYKKNSHLKRLMFQKRDGPKNITPSIVCKVKVWVK